MQTNSKLKLTVYSPDSSLKNPASLLRAIVSDIVSGRELAWRLAVRDISAQYRQAALGILWAFILPLVNTITWVFLSESGIVSLGETSIPYPVYVFVGTMLWQILIESINAPLTETNAAKAMLSKLNFPREALIISGIYKTIFNSVIKIALMITAVIIFGVYPSWSIAFLPLGLLSLIITGTAIGLLLTPIGILYTDIGKVIPLFMQFLMYITPVVFVMPTTGLAATIFRVNPFTYLILTIRDWITGSQTQYITEYLFVVGISIVVLLVVIVVYRLAMPMLIERMSA